MPCITDQTDEEWEEQVRLATRVQTKRRRCKRCVDMFADTWTRRLLHPVPRVRRLALRKLRTIVASTFFNAAKCERKHIIGQETHPRKKKRKSSSPGPTRKVHVSEDGVSRAQADVEPGAKRCLRPQRLDDADEVFESFDYVGSGSRQSSSEGDPRAFLRGEHPKEATEFFWPRRLHEETF